MATCETCRDTSDLREWRKAHGLKAYQVAELLGYSVEHISRVENGARNLSRAAWASLTCSIEHKETNDEA